MRARVLVCVMVVVAAGCAASPPPPGPLPVARLAARAPDARCSACTLPFAAEPRQWPDGRVVCASCHADAVVDPADAQVLLAAAREDLARFGVRLDRAARVELRLVDQPTLLAHARELAHPALQAFSTIGRGVVAIEALYGLPRAPLRAILVHELFHAHQTARRAASGPADPAFVEGAAQYVQLRVLEALGAHAWAARLVANEDPIYGRGLRRFRRLVAVTGEARAIERGATDVRFPAGY